MKTYKEAQQHQLDEWVAGRPWHNPFNMDNTRHDEDTSQGECCPDFSCCNPKSLVDEDARKAFYEAGDEERMQLLGSFFSAALITMGEEAGQKVHIITPSDNKAH